MRDTLAGRGQVNYSDLTDAEVNDLRALVSSFLEGNATVDQLPSQTLKQVKETYRQMQLAYQAAKSSQVGHACLLSVVMYHGVICQRKTRTVHACCLFLGGEYQYTSCLVRGSMRAFLHVAHEPFCY